VQAARTNASAAKASMGLRRSGFIFVFLLVRVFPHDIWQVCGLSSSIPIPRPKA
jgi:hypothetical protein